MAQKFVGTRPNRDRCADTGKVRTRDEIIACFHDGQTISIGGQAGSNYPWRLIDCILESGAKHLTIYSIDAGDPDFGPGRLVHAGRVDRMIATHLGSNPEASQMMVDGEIQIEERDNKLTWVCPNCGNDDESKLNVARRTCGYIGTQFWNQGRTQEIKERVVHLSTMSVKLAEAI